jgi:hypothetical protein
MKVARVTFRENRAFKRIESSDIFYVIAKEGYVEKAVSLEIAYAFSKRKEVISSEVIEDFSLRALGSRVMSPEKLIKYVKGRNP